MKITLTSGGHSGILFRTADTHLTVEDLLLSARKRRPQLYATWCDESGRLRESLTVFINGEHIRYRNGFRTELKDGDEVYVIPLIAGG